MASYKLIVVFMMNFFITNAEDYPFQSSCSIQNKTTPNSAFQQNLKSLLSYLSSNATTGNKEFYNTTVSGTETVYGMFVCWGDVPPEICRQCVANASVFSDPEQCSLSKDVQVSNNECMVRYTLAQCTPDLSDSDCDNCLRNIFQNQILWCCLASPEGKVLYPSCFMMFGLSKFYSDGDQFGPLSPPPRSTTENKKKNRSKTTITIIIPIIACAVLLSCCCCCLLRRKARNSNYKTLLKKNFGDESTTLENLQFDLATIIQQQQPSVIPIQWRY